MTIITYTHVELFDMYMVHYFLHRDCRTAETHEQREVRLEVQRNIQRSSQL